MPSFVRIEFEGRLEALDLTTREQLRKSLGSTVKDANPSEILRLARMKCFDEVAGYLLPDGGSAVQNTLWIYRRSIMDEFGFDTLSLSLITHGPCHASQATTYESIGLHVLAEIGIKRAARCLLKP
jgi:hypothetical protein